MPPDVIAQRYSGEGPTGLWRRKFEQGRQIMDPAHPWVASVGGDERVFKTFRDAVDFLYFKTRGTQYREPTTE